MRIGSKSNRTRHEGAIMGTITIEELEQYLFEKRECEDLKRREAQYSGRGNVVRDTVRGSMTEYPYTAHTIRIEGVSSRSINTRSRLQRQYSRKRKALMEHTLRIEHWLETVQDSKIRCIVRYRYMDGLSWSEVSRRVFGKRSANHARMALNRYFTKCS